MWKHCKQNFGILLIWFFSKRQLIDTFHLQDLFWFSVDYFNFKELKNAEGAQSKVDAAREQVFGPQGLKHLF